MITAHKKNRGARLPLPIKKAIALESGPALRPLR